MNPAPHSDGVAAQCAAAVEQDRIDVRGCQIAAKRVISAILADPKKRMTRAFALVMWCRRDELHLHPSM